LKDAISEPVGNKFEMFGMVALGEFKTKYPKLRTVIDNT
jgi:hypothetical protein